jgi:hypothetical protein
MQEASDANEAGDNESKQYANMMVDYFTKQLNESNPILTEISDAMTEEGRCEEMLSSVTGNDEKEQWEGKRNEAAKKKKEGSTKLMECSSRYSQKMRDIRRARLCGTATT